MDCLLPAASSVGFEGIPDELIPYRFKLANIENSKVIIGLVVTYAVLGCILLLSSYFIGQSITPISALQILAIGGDGISVGILVFSMSVKQYSQEKYVSSYKAKSKSIPDYEKDSQDELTGMLEQFHGQLQDATTNILKNELGATLLGISTTVGFIAAALKG